jgi:hypothetical protein
VNREGYLGLVKRSEVKCSEGPVKNVVLYLLVNNIRNCYVLFFLPIVLLFLYAFCFNLYCGCFILFCNVCECECACGCVCESVCVCVCGFL